MSGGIPSWARVGAKVVCVDASLAPGMRWFDNEAPVEGEVYTITDVGYDHEVRKVTVYLAEICRGPTHVLFYGRDLGYWLGRFRPVHTLETDISEHFQQFLKTPSRQRELAE